MVGHLTSLWSSSPGRIGLTTGRLPERWQQGPPGFTPGGLFLLGGRAHGRPVRPEPAQPRPARGLRSRLTHVRHRRQDRLTSPAERWERCRPAVRDPTPVLADLHPPLSTRQATQRLRERATVLFLAVIAGSGAGDLAEDVRAVSSGREELVDRSTRVRVVPVLRANRRKADIEHRVGGEGHRLDATPGRRQSAR